MEALNNAILWVQKHQPDHPSSQCLAAGLLGLVHQATVNVFCNREWIHPSVCPAFTSPYLTAFSVSLLAIGIITEILRE